MSDEIVAQLIYVARTRTDEVCDVRARAEDVDVSAAGSGA